MNIFWFRRDLRLEDNHGLHEALKAGNVLPLFIFDKDILEHLDSTDMRVSFIHDTLSNIQKELRRFGSDLYTFYGSPKESFEKLSRDFDIHKVYTNDDYEPYATKRDLDIEKLLKTKDINFESFKDQCIFHKNDVLKKDGKPYTVFTPFKNKWYETLTVEDLKSYTNKDLFDHFHKFCCHDIITLKEMSFEKVNVPNDIKSIKTKIVKEYDKMRDLPYVMGTTRLGLHLRFGTVSVRKCAQVGHELNRTWLDELIWREFFMQILYHFPHVVDRSFKEKYDAIKWQNDKEDFKKWCEGKTGYPLVDAGMRELNNTGFMHNRVRMLVGSFLVKHLLIDWRWGERYFAKKLLDFELSANNGNWQWCAGTGCDAAPYFRIFNPHTQLKKFDPNLEYVKKWVPEYGTEEYIPEMVEHSFARERALSTYKKYLN